MNFIHNITLNFHKNLYETYEWDSTDKLIHVKKIPIFKINKKDYFKIKNNVIQFKKDFLGKIFKQNQLMKENKQMNYIFLVACDEDVIGLQLNKEGTVIKKSSILFEETKLILRTIHKINKTILKFDILKEENSNQYMTRLEKEKIQKIINLLQKLYSQNETEKLAYLYLECFNKVQKNKEIIFSELKKEISKKNDSFYKTIDFFKLIKQNL